jgi:hypothetical protein
LTGSVALTITPTGTVLGAAVLTGSSALTLTPTAALGGAVPAVGAVGLTFTAAGAVTGVGRLAGSADADLETAGVLRGAGAVVGLSEINFTATTNIIGYRLASGTADMTFSAAATGGAEGALIGVAGVSFTPLATVAGEGVLAGTTAMTFGGVAVVQQPSAGQPVVLWVSQTVDTIAWSDKEARRVKAVQQYRWPIRKTSPHVLRSILYRLDDGPMDLTDFVSVTVLVKSQGGEVEELTAEFGEDRTTGEVLYVGYQFSEAGEWGAQFVAVNADGDPVYGEPLRITVAKNLDDLALDELPVL